MIRRTLFDLDARVTNVLGSLLCTGESYGERTLVRQHEARREDRKKNYEALAVEYVKEMSFPGIGRAPASMQEAIRFHVMEDVEEDGEHPGWQKPTRSIYSFSSLAISYLIFLQ